MEKERKEGKGGKGKECCSENKKGKSAAVKGGEGEKKGKRRGLDSVKHEDRKMSSFIRKLPDQFWPKENPFP